MGRQAIFLSNEKFQDLECYPNGPPTHTSSVAPEPAESASSIRSFVKWALICTLTVLAMTFISELFRNQTPAEHRDYYGEIPKVCPSTKYRKTVSFDFNKPTNLAFAQESHDSRLHGPEFHIVRIVGKVEVLKQDSLSNIRIALDIRSSDPQLSSESLRIVKSDSALTVKTPRRTPRESSSASGAEVPCIYVSATISIPSGTTLENLGINTETLSVTFFPGLDYAITNHTEVQRAMLS